MKTVLFPAFVLTDKKGFRGVVARAFAIKTLGVKKETIAHEAVKIAEVVK